MSNAESHKSELPGELLGQAARLFQEAFQAAARPNALTVTQFLSEWKARQSEELPPDIFAELLYECVHLRLERDGIHEPVVDHEDLLFGLAWNRAATCEAICKGIGIVFETVLDDADSARPELVADYAACLPEKCGANARAQLVELLVVLHVSRCGCPPEDYVRVLPDDATSIRRCLGGAPTFIPESPAAGVAGSAGGRDWTDRELGDYQIKKKLGGGGLGDVWSAIYKPDGSWRAVKFAADRLADNTTFIDQWLQKAEGNMALQHPRIVPILDVVRHPECGGFVVMEFIQGGQTLFELLKSADKNDPGSWPRVVDSVRAVADLADVLQEFHSNQRLHLDIKPDNLFARRGPKGLELLAFDIDMTDSEEEFQLRNATLVHTRQFAPYELRSGVRPPAYQLGTKSETYQLAMVLSCLLTGRTNPLPPAPTTGDQTDLDAYWHDALPLCIGDKSLKILKDEVLRNDIVQTLPVIFRKATTKDLEQRSSVSEFAHQLRDWLKAAEAAPQAPLASLRRNFWLAPIQDLEERFYPRSEMEAVLGCLDPAHRLNPAHRTIPVITGASGIGKTRIALRAAGEAVKRGWCDHLFTIDGSSEAAVQNSLGAIAKHVDGNAPADSSFGQRDDEQLNQRGLAILGNAQFATSLLLIDNLIDVAAVQKYLEYLGPLLARGELACLVTTVHPNPDLGSMSEFRTLIEVGDLDETAGVDFLRWRASRDLISPVVNAAANEEVKVAKEHKAASKLVAAVGGRVLLLDQLGAWLNEQRRSGTSATFQDLAAAYEDVDGWWLRADRGSGAPEHPDSYTTTILLLLSSLSEPTRNLVLFCAELANEPIPESLFPVNRQDYGEGLSPLAATHFQLTQFLGEALRSGLLVSADHRRYVMHRAVRDVLRDLASLPEECINSERLRSIPRDRDHWQSQARRAIGRWLVDNHRTIEDWESGHLFYEHAAELATLTWHSAYDAMCAYSAFVDGPFDQEIKDGLKQAAMANTPSEHESTCCSLEFACSQMLIYSLTKSDRELVTALRLLLAILASSSEEVAEHDLPLALFGLFEALEVVVFCSIDEDGQLRKALLEATQRSTKWRIPREHVGRHLHTYLVANCCVGAKPDFGFVRQQLDQLQFAGTPRDEWWLPDILGLAALEAREFDDQELFQRLNVMLSDPSMQDTRKYAFLFEVTDLKDRKDIANEWLRSLSEMDISTPQGARDFATVSELLSQEEAFFDDLSISARITVELLDKFESFYCLRGQMPGHLELLFYGVSLQADQCVLSEDVDANLFWKLCRGLVLIEHFLTQRGRKDLAFVEFEYGLLSLSRWADYLIQAKLATMEKHPYKYDCPCGSGDKVKYCRQKRGKDHLQKAWDAIMRHEGMPSPGAPPSIA